MSSGVVISTPPPTKSAKPKEQYVKSGLNSQITGRFESEIKDINHHLDTAENKLNGLRTVFGDNIVNRAMSRRTSFAGTARGTSRSGSQPVNSAVAASRRLQGEYMGLMRHLTGRERSRIKKIAQEKGREAAVKEMRKGQN